MKAIYSCKLYRSSTRKEKIRAAVESPINVELVKQLRSYLDEEYQTDEYLDLGHDDPDYVAEVKPDETIRPSETSGGGSSGGGGGFEMFDLPDSGEAEFGGDADDASNDDGSADVEIDVPDDEVSEAEEILGIEDSGIDPSRDPDGLKEYLNESEDTSGVYRVSLKTNDEMWVYYSDKINLNNVMESVITSLLKSEYSDLEFNRLARTENAIVFEIPNQSVSEE